jgi:hypothetical protein
MGYRCAIHGRDSGCVVDKEDAILISRDRCQGSTLWAVLLVKKGADLTERGIKGYAHNLGSLAWLNESNLTIIDTNIETNIKFYDWCEMVDDFACSDCGYWHGKEEDVADYDENICPRCHNTEEGYEAWLQEEGTKCQRK